MGLAALLSGEDPTSAYNGLSSKIPNRQQEAYNPANVSAQGYNAAQIGQNALAGANGSQAGQQAQEAAIGQLQQQASGQLNAADKASLYQALGRQGEQNRGQQAAIQQQAAERGNTNSGTAMASALAAQQATQEAGANAGVDVAGQAANRALQAAGQEGQLGAGLNEQTLQQQQMVGGAQNAINAQNAAATNRANEFGANAANNMNQFNESNQIGADQFNAGLQQQQFQNNLNLANGKAGAAQAQETADNQMLGNVVGGLGSFGAAAMGSDGISGKGLARGGEVGSTLKTGGKVPGKAQVPGDSYTNDTVAAKLSPGELVISRETKASPERLEAFLRREAGEVFEQMLARNRKPAKNKGK